MKNKDVIREILLDLIDILKLADTNISFGDHTHDTFDAHDIVRLEELEKKVKKL